MRYDLQLRPAMTALAAVIALSTTPAFAQGASQPALQPPIATAPAADVPAEPAAAPIEVAPALSQAETAPVEPQAVPVAPPVPTMQPIIHQPSETDLRAARIADRTASPPRAVAPQPIARAASRPEAPMTAASAPVARVAAPLATPEQTAAPVAPARSTTAATGATGVDEYVVPYIGVGAAALLLFGGAAALSRRRRRDGDLDPQRDHDEQELDLSPATRVAESLPAAPITARAVAAPTIAAGLPNGFDLSRYGRHTQAAYRGPTAENPSLSLRRRLKRASFFDGRERVAAETGIAPVGTPIAAAARTAPAQAAADGQIVIRPRPAQTGNFFRPSFVR